MRGYVALAAPARGDLGRLVHVHQDRGRRARADDDDGSPARLLGDPAARDRRPQARAADRRSARCARSRGPRWSSGSISTALPFTLIAWGETKIDSGVAAIGNASMPIFVAILAIKFRSSERATGSRSSASLLGLLGVGVLAGVNPKGGWWAVAGRSRSSSRRSRTRSARSTRRACSTTCTTTCSRRPR